MSVYLKIGNCTQCPFLGRKGLFDNTPFCKKAKRGIPHKREVLPPYSARMRALSFATFEGHVPQWCPLSKTLDLPERLPRDAAEHFCELSCKAPCARDCDCNPDIQKAWKQVLNYLASNTDAS